MLELIHILSKCLEIPCIALLLICFCIDIRKKESKILLCLFAIMILWRLMFKELSGRYFISIIFFMFITFATTYHHVKNKFRIFLDVMLLLTFFYGLIHDLTSFNNIYIYDIQDDLMRFSQKDKTKIAISSKELRRFSSKKNNDGTDNKWMVYRNLSTNPFEYLKEYEFWKYNLVIVTNFRNMIFNTDNEHIYGGIKRIRQYISNKKKTKSYNLYLIQRTIPKTESLKDKTNGYIYQVLKSGDLKTCDPASDVYIYSLDNSLIWFVSNTVSEKTELIFHVYTSMRELLNEDRVKHGFDNFGFNIKSKNKIDYVDGYNVYKFDLPTHYPISLIRTGLNCEGTITWFNPFKVP